MVLDSVIGRRMWIAFKGNQATNGSTWENQALWDFNNNALETNSSI